MKSFISALDSLPKVFKILLALPIIDILWIVYRVGKSMEKENSTNVILAVVAGILLLPVLWIVDIVSIAKLEKVLWID